MLLESDILRFFFTGPYLVSSPLCSGVWCWLPLCGSTPTSLFASLLSSLNCPPWSPAATLILLLASLLSSHQLFSLLSSHQLFSAPVQPQLPSLCSPATNCLSLVQLPTASLWVASSTLVRVPLPLPDTARFQVQESFVWFRAKTDSSALAAYPHSATLVPSSPF